MSRIRQKGEQTNSPTSCNTGVYKLKSCLEIIYIILSNKLSNYRNIETVAQNFGVLGTVSLAAVSAAMMRVT